MEINVHYYHNVHLITFITCTSKFNWQKKKVFLFVMRILRIYSLNRLPLQCTAVLLTITLPYCTLHP